MIRAALLLGNAVSVMSALVFLISALTMVGYWVVALTGWLGWIGTVVAVLTAPAAVTFPFVHWFVVGSPTAVYFGIWGAGLAGLVIALTWMGMARGTPAVPAQDVPAPELPDEPTERSA